MVTSTISSKGQITIPKQIREFLKVQASDKISFIPLEDGKVIMTSKQKSASRLFGMLKQYRPKQPVSLADMEKAVQEKRLRRGEPG